MWCKFMQSSYASNVAPKLITCGNDVVLGICMYNNISMILFLAIKHQPIAVIPDRQNEHQGTQRHRVMPQTTCA